jgi:hypothetical protein
LYQKIVLAESFHLSYPYVFKWDDTFYMIPETRKAGAVRLYRATSFPDIWSYAGDLLDVEGTDPSVFHLDGKWWMFICAPPAGHDTLRLYLADELVGPWSEHPASPVVRKDPRSARPAGRVTLYDDRVIRYAQECNPHYGSRVRAFEVTEITPESYAERESESSPILVASGSGWNRDGMHHVDPHHCPGNGWIACVDGWIFSERAKPSAIACGG